jgi:hypothetical protein
MPVMDEKIFVSIASFLDSELRPTVERLLCNAKNPENISVFVFSQNEDDAHPELDSLFSKYGGSLNYTKINYRDTRGVCWVRAEILKNLSDEYKYYLQLDSHMAFAEEWDAVLIEDYQKALETVGDCIYTVYPPGYDYVGDDVVLDVVPHIPRIPIYVEGKPTKFLPREVDSLRTSLFGKPYGSKSFWFSGGFVFGYSSHFIETPYDPNFFFDGEEQSMSLRLFAKGVTLLSPPRPCIYHYYKMDKKIYVHDVKSFNEYYQKADERIKEFFTFQIDGEFGVSPDIIYRWIIASRDLR